jgi:hypothetical protein
MAQQGEGLMIGTEEDWGRKKRKREKMTTKKLKGRRVAM